ncbi:Protein argonaute 16 [Platanthera guangdongensis]|uniref:Protein argonaute 16 n=1 Tax=Platanthera guangdongensis TaxID=2320717 RepID=A0ABR2LF87_9ASPA
MVSPAETPTEESLSTLPAPPVTPIVVPELMESDHVKRTVMGRPGFGTKGRQIQLLTNEFGVSLKTRDQFFCQYTISIKTADNLAAEGRRSARKVLERLYQIYGSELGGKEFAYDGDNNLFTVGSLPHNNFDFTVVLEESRRVPLSPGGESLIDDSRKLSKFSFTPKTLSVQIRYAAKIPLDAIGLAHVGNDANHAQDALKVLNLILRQRQEKCGSLLVRQSYFDGDSANFIDLGGGVTGCRGFHSSFRTTHSGLSLNMDVSTTIVVKPGPVIDFLFANQNVRSAKEIDWDKAKRTLKNMRIKTLHTNMEFKIIGLSPLPCSEQTFPLKGKNGHRADLSVEVTVFNYFKEKCIELTWSSYLPCLAVGRPKNLIYLPMELCNLVSLQRYTKALSSHLKTSMVEKSRQKPPEQIRSVTKEFQKNRYNEDQVLSSCGITIEKQLTHIDGRILNAPTLKFGESEVCLPKDGRWNFNNKKLLQAKHIESWAIVNFSSSCDLSHLSREIISCGRNKGIIIDRPFAIIEESHQNVRMEPVVRVEKMFEEVKKRFPKYLPELLLCVLPEKKNSAIYGPWKKKCLHEEGAVTQCIAPTKIKDRYLTNVLLKINTKLDGINYLLEDEANPSIPLVTEVPTLIVGMTISHGFPRHAGLPSVAVAVGSRNWPLISRYNASVRTQSANLEMIDSLYKPFSEREDSGMMRDLLCEFFNSTGGRKPAQIIIFRDGVCESQFIHVLNIELDQVIKAFQRLGEANLPKFTVIVAQKNHHTKLFQVNSSENVPPGTVVDTAVVHPRNYDFYMCSQAGMIGTSRPTHYHVLLDEIGFSPDNIQNLVHSLSYVCQRSTAATSIVAPIHYARSAARQMSHFVKSDDLSDSSSQGDEGWNSVVPEMPKLDQFVRNSMFFC